MVSTLHHSGSLVKNADFKSLDVLLVPCLEWYGAPELVKGNSLNFWRRLVTVNVWGKKGIWNNAPTHLLIIHPSIHLIIQRILNAHIYQGTVLKFADTALPKAYESPCLHGI